MNIKNIIRNEKIYPIYRMFGYDYLFYSVISFLFYTITKGITVGQVMYLSAFSAIFIAILQVPTNYIVEKIGFKKSMILGNLFWIIHCIILIIAPSFELFALAEAICSFGTCLKGLSETQILYSSLKYTKNRKNFGKIEGKGVSYYYYFEAISALFVGALFEINNYLPMICTLTFLIISFVTSMFFENVKEEDTKKSNVKDYLKGFKLILKSKRVISIFIYAFVISGFVVVAKTLQKSTIVELQVSPIEYSLIFAVITLCVGLGSSIQYKFEKITGKKTLTVIGTSYIILICLLGIINIIITNRYLALIFSIVILIVHNILQGIYRISIKKYMNNFTTHHIRGKILSVFYIFEAIGKSLLLFLSGLIIDKVGTNITSVIIGIIGIIVILIILKYLKKHLGLKPEQYNENDIFGMDIKNK
ncbi:MAG: MFS transporter [Clostridia bacterium]